MTEGKEVHTMANETTEGTALVQYKGTPVTIAADDVRRFLCPLATVKEIALFLKTCQSLQLNPFANEIYLIKYGVDDKAAIVIAIESYLKAAELNDNYDGHQAGVILKDSTGKLEEREGAFVREEEADKVVGGWARVFRKDRAKPYYIGVHKRECVRFRKDGTPTEFWQEAKQPWMLRKVALSRALVEAFPSLLAGLNPSAEYEELPPEVVSQLPKPRGESEEGQEPQAFTKNSKPDWSLFWAKLSERGITDVEAHSRLNVASIKADLIEKQGKTLEEVFDMLIATRGEPPQEKAPPIDTTTVEKANKVKKEDVTTLNALTRICHDIWNLQPTDVWKELGYKSMAEVTESPWDCFLKVKATRGG